VLAGGQGSLKGKVFRIGHMGHISEADVYAVLGTLEQGMAELGMLSRVGLCVAAAQASITQGVRPEPAGVG
jgi:aspartate aminotransferase-like enzyme